MTDTYRTPHVAIDAVLLTLKAGKLMVCLQRRDREPFLDQLALPGGYVHVDRDQSTLDTARRVLKEKTGFVPRYIEQLGTFSGPGRDPRGWSIAVAYVALVPMEELEAVAEGVFEFCDVDGLPELAFDHAEQVRTAVERVRNKSSYSTLPCWLLPEKFTLTDLQRTYEHVRGEKMTRATFRTRLGIKATEAVAGESADQGSILVATDEFRGGSQRPARLYSVNHLSLFEKAMW